MQQLRAVTIGCIHRVVNIMSGKQVSSVDAVSEKLVGYIRDGQVAPGQRLVESELAVRLGVARTTVREALQRLEVYGLVGQERHRGFLVRRLDRVRLQEVYAVREALEALAARLAAPVVAAHPEAMEAVMAELGLAQAESDLKRFSHANRKFHGIIRDASGNSILRETLERLELSVYHLQFRLMVERPQVFNSNEEHRRIAVALQKGDAERAARESADHVRHSLTELLNLPDSYFES